MIGKVNNLNVAPALLSSIFLFVQSAECHSVKCHSAENDGKCTFRLCGHVFDDVIIGWMGSSRRILISAGAPEAINIRSP